MSTRDEALTPLGPGHEFDRIRSILTGLSTAQGVRLGPGDDGAILAEGIVLSTDLSVEGVHFRLDWITAEEAGWRAAAAALSDLAAMGASPAGILASVAVPGEGELALSVMDGVRGAAAAVGAPLLGGDLTRSPGPIVVDLTVVGRVEHPLLRRGARVGDGVWVTGSLGWAGAAVQAWMAGRTPSPESRQAFLRPEPRIREAQWLVEVAGATAGLDLSDGLAGDAGHLASASGVGIMLWSRALQRLAPPGPGGVSLALHAGEDYELLVTLPADFSPERVDQFREKFDLTLTRVGKVVEEPGVWLLPAAGGVAAPVPRGGWDAFRDATEPKP